MALLSHRGHERACLWERGVLGCPPGAPHPLTCLPPPPRFLVKSYLQSQAPAGSTSERPLPQSVAYLTAPDLARCPAQRPADFLRPELYTRAWVHVAVR